MWPNQVFQLRGAVLQRSQEQPSVPQFVFVGRILQNLDRFLVGGILFLLRMLESQPIKSLIVRE